MGADVQDCTSCMGNISNVFIIQELSLWFGGLLTYFTEIQNPNLKYSSLFHDLSLFKVISSSDNGLREVATDHCSILINLLIILFLLSMPKNYSNCTLFCEAESQFPMTHNYVCIWR